MNDNYNKISYEFINFKTKLNNEINNSYWKNSVFNECYCIKEKWYIEFEQQINEINTKKSITKDTKNILINIFFEKNKPEFINDISTAINILENKSNIKLLSKSFVHSLDSEKINLKCNSVKYYAGNNRLIIEFKNEISDIYNYLLIIYQLEKDFSQKQIYNISFNNKVDIKKNEIIKYLIEKEITEKMFPSLGLKVSKLKLGNDTLNELKENKLLSSEKQSDSFNIILKFLIAIYYYEISLTNKSKAIMLNKNEKSYLINPEWIENIKSLYKYAQLKKILYNIKNEFDYSNFITQVNQIYNYCKNNFEIQNISISADTFFRNIIPKEKNSDNNITFIESCYILPKIIIKIIGKLLLSNSMFPLHYISHFWKKNNICLLKNNFIYIGYMNNSNNFIAENVLFYIDEKISSSEFDYLFSLQYIKDYFHKRNINEFLTRNQNIYKNNKSIGIIFFVKNILPSKKGNKALAGFINKNKEAKKEKNIHRSMSLPRLVESITSSLREKLNNVVTEKNNYKKEEHNKLNRSIEKTNADKNNIDTNMKKIYEKMNKIDKKEDDIINVNINNKDNKNDIIENEKELNDLKALNILLNQEKEKNKKSEEIINSLRAKLKEKEEFETKSLRESQKKDDEIDKTTSLKEDLEKKHNELKEKIKSLEEKLSKQKESESKNLGESQRKDEEIKNITSSNLKLEEENISLKEKLDELQKQNEINKEKLEKKDKKKEKEKEIKEKIKNLEILNKEKDSEVENMKKELEKYIAENKILNQKNNELSKENNSLQIELEEKKKEIEKLKKESKKKKESQILNKGIMINIDQYENNNISINSLNKNKESSNKKRSHSMPSTKEKPLDTYLQPTLIGLNNIGATCYMNSTLQCLSQTAALTNYFLTEKNQNYIDNINLELSKKNELCLTKVYSNLIKKLWSKRDFQSSFSPQKFFDTVSNMNPLFQKGDPGDAKDFIIFILEQIHRELKKSVINLTNINKIDQLNQYDKKNAFNNFFEDFKKECSIISDVFFGFNETTNICLNCKNNYNSRGMENPVCYNYSIFNCIIIPLEEVKNMKNNYYGTNVNNVNMQECFIYNQKSELFTGENMNYCNICRQLFNSVYTSKIYVSPNYLIIILNRGKGNVFHVKLDFTLQIDITDFVEFKNERTIYDLYGVITHIGQSGPNAHFVATCKSPIDNKWYRYNDAMVTPINNMQTEVFDFGVPYILFYEKHNDNKSNFNKY